jgi:hypothetical protein
VAILFHPLGMSYRLCRSDFHSRPSGAGWEPGLLALLLGPEGAPEQWVEL